MWGDGMRIPDLIMIVAEIGGCYASKGKQAIVSILKLNQGLLSPLRSLTRF